MVTRVKICGITRAEDALAAAELGADAIGLNFLAGPRQIDIARGRSIVSELGEMPFAPTLVALCGLPSQRFPKSLTAGEVGGHLDIRRFQVYGTSQTKLLSDDGSPPYWLVCPVATREAITNVVVMLAVDQLRPQAILLDTASPSGHLGGTGKTFDWKWIAEAREAGELAGLPPLILAGGLTAENVGEAVRIVRPYAVDVSSGVEVAGRPGIKDPIKMRDFIQAVKSG